MRLYIFILPLAPLFCLCVCWSRREGDSKGLFGLSVCFVLEQDKLMNQRNQMNQILATPADPPGTILSRLL